VLQLLQLPAVQVHVVPPAGIIPTVQAAPELELELELVVAPELELELDEVPDDELPVVVPLEELLVAVMPLLELPVADDVEPPPDEALPLDEELPV
jgi:hypothetical protein